jgi:hypothetical protein
MTVNQAEIASIADDAAYVLTAISGYTGFVAAQPTIAFYLGLTAAALFALSNRLAAIAPPPTPAPAPAAP